MFINFTDNVPSSKLSDSGSNKGSTSSSVRRRDTSTDSINVIKSEDYESHIVTAATDISINNLPPLYDPKDIKDKVNYYFIKSIFNVNCLNVTSAVLFFRILNLSFFMVVAIGMCF